MVCANPDIVIHRGDTLVYCAGALAERFEALGGEVVYAGKPHPPIYRRALALARKARGGRGRRAEGPRRRRRHEDRHRRRGAGGARRASGHARHSPHSAPWGVVRHGRGREQAPAALR